MEEQVQLQLYILQMLLHIVFVYNFFVLCIYNLSEFFLYQMQRKYISHTNLHIFKLIFNYKMKNN